MLKNGIHAVRVVHEPIAGMCDVSNQILQGDILASSAELIAISWFRNTLIDAEIIESSIQQALDTIKVQFSHVDIKRIIPMCDDDRPEDIAFNFQCGQSYIEDQPSELGPGLLDLDKMYELRPVLLSMTEVVNYMKTANRISYCAGIDKSQLEIAIKMLQEAHDKVLLGNKSVTDFPAPAVVILNGRQIRFGIGEKREDVFLNVLFGHDPQQYARRLASLVPSQLRRKNVREIKKQKIASNGWILG